MQPWDIKNDDSRIAESLPTFIIFCEDEICENIYFKYFETSAIKVNPIAAQKSKTENVLKAITHCVAQGLMQENVEGKAILDKNDVQVWCVFDRDKEPNDAELPLGNTKFNQSIQTAINSGIQMAWSNDAFELWILLHFEDVDPEIAESAQRTTYYTRLTEIFKSIPEPHPDLEKALMHATFSYKKDLKSEKKFRNIVREELIRKDKHMNAVERAKILHVYHEKQNSPPHEQAPCTLVYKLVEELLRLGGKQLN